MFACFLLCFLPKQRFKVVILAKCVLAILELNWNQHFGNKATKLNICYHMLASSSQIQNRSLHVVERTRTSARCSKMKTARAKRVKLLFFHCQICKFVTFLLPLSLWLLKLPNDMISWRRRSGLEKHLTTSNYDKTFPTNMMKYEKKLRH